MKVKDLLDKLQNYSPEQEIFDIDYDFATLLEIDGDLILSKEEVIDEL